MRKMAFQEANNLLKTKDFDDDGSSECLGASIKDITLYKSDSLMTGDYPVPEAFLKRCNQQADGFFFRIYDHFFFFRFSLYDFDGYCLGVLFTNRVFNDLVLGLSWRGNSSPNGVGGVCQNRYYSIQFRT